MDEKLVRILCCPATRQSLRSADDETVARLNARIPGGNLSDKSGEVVKDVFDAGLVREDGKVLYPVRKGVPILLVSAAIGIGDDESAETAQSGAEEETSEGD